MGQQWSKQRSTDLVSLAFLGLTPVLGNGGWPYQVHWETSTPQPWDRGTHGPQLFEKSQRDVGTRERANSLTGFLALRQSERRRSEPSTAISIVAVVLQSLDAGVRHRWGPYNPFSSRVPRLQAARNPADSTAPTPASGNPSRSLSAGPFRPQPREPQGSGAGGTSHAATQRETQKRPRLVRPSRPEGGERRCGLVAPRAVASPTIGRRMRPTTHSRVRLCAREHARRHSLTRLRQC